MSRESGDEIKKGLVFNGYDYTLQAWIKNGVIQDCGHPRYMGQKMPCCNQHAYAGWYIFNIDQRLVDHRSVPNPV